MKTQLTKLKKVVDLIQVLKNLVDSNGVVLNDLKNTQALIQKVWDPTKVPAIGTPVNPITLAVAGNDLTTLRDGSNLPFQFVADSKHEVTLGNGADIASVVLVAGRANNPTVTVGNNTIKLVLSTAGQLTSTTTGGAATTWTLRRWEAVASAFSQILPGHTKQEADLRFVLKTTYDAYKILVDAAIAKIPGIETDVASVVTRFTAMETWQNAKEIDLTNVQNLLSQLQTSVTDMATLIGADPLTAFNDLTEGVNFLYDTMQDIINQIQSIIAVNVHAVSGVTPIGSFTGELADDALVKNLREKKVLVGSAAVVNLSELDPNERIITRSSLDEAINDLVDNELVPIQDDVLQAQTDIDALRVELNNIEDVSLDFNLVLKDGTEIAAKDYHPTAVAANVDFALDVIHTGYNSVFDMPAGFTTASLVPDKNYKFTFTIPAGTTPAPTDASIIYLWQDNALKQLWIPWIPNQPTLADVKDKIVVLKWKQSNAQGDFGWQRVREDVAPTAVVKSPHALREYVDEHVKDAIKPVEDDIVAVKAIINTLSALPTYTTTATWVANGGSKILNIDMPTEIIPGGFSGKNGDEFILKIDRIIGTAPSGTTNPVYFLNAGNYYFLKAADASTAPLYAEDNIPGTTMRIKAIAGTNFGIKMKTIIPPTVLGSTATADYRVVERVALTEGWVRFDETTGTIDYNKAYRYRNGSDVFNFNVLTASTMRTSLNFESPTQANYYEWSTAHRPEVRVHDFMTGVVSSGITINAVQFIEERK